MKASKPVNENNRPNRMGRILVLALFITVSNLFGVWIASLFVWGNPVFNGHGQLWLLAWLVTVLIFSGIGTLVGSYVINNLWPLKERN